MAKLATLLLLISANLAQAADWQGYRQAAEQLKANIDSQPATLLQQQAEQLVDRATPLLRQVIAQQPQCQAYLQAALNAAKQMQQLPLERIEADYHADGKLPAVNDPLCYHAKDLLVHPATMVVLTQQSANGPKQQLHAEIDEVLEHLEQVRNSVLN